MGRSDVYTAYNNRLILEKLKMFYNNIILTVNIKIK